MRQMALAYYKLAWSGFCRCWAFALRRITRGH